MAQIPTPPSTPALDALPDHATLTLELDSLLERYLYLLDQHQTLHAQLSKQFSSVRLLLALLIPLMLIQPLGVLLPRPSKLRSAWTSTLWARLLR